VAETGGWHFLVSNARSDLMVKILGLKKVSVWQLFDGKTNVRYRPFGLFTSMRGTPSPPARGFSPNRRPSLFHLPWAVAFLANFFVSVALPFRLSESPIDTITQMFDKVKDVAVPGGLRIALEVALALTIVHVVYALFFSTLYVKFALICLVLESIASFVFILTHAAVMPTLYLLLGPLALICAALYYHYAWHHLATKSAALMRGSVSVITANPAIFVTQAINLVVTFSAILFYGASIALVFATDASFLLAAYFAFSCFWLVSTLGYTQLVISAGVTDCYTRTRRGNVVANIIKATVYMIGASAFCGFLVAFLRTAHWLLQLGKPTRKKKDDDDNSGIDWFYIARLILYHILKFILENFIVYVEYLSRNTLIYCSLFNVPLGDGHRMLCSSGIQRRWEALEQNSMIGAVTYINSFVMVVLAGALSAAIGWAKGYASAVLWTMAGVSAAAMLVLSVNLMSVVQDVADTMFLCFAMEPARAKRFVPDFAVEW
jgi:hypothetical protein